MNKKKFRCLISELDIESLVKRQTQNLFPLDGDEVKLLAVGVEAALTRAAICFARVDNKHYRDGDIVIFNPYNSSQYTAFLYFIARAVRSENILLADKIFMLNKCLNAVDLYHDVALPDIFYFGHTVGAVIGRASYSNCIRFSQNVTIGNNKGVYPVFKKNVSLLTGSTVIGKCEIGENVVISAGAYVKDTDVPDDVVVFGRDRDLKFVPAETVHVPKYFRD